MRRQKVYFRIYTFPRSRVSRMMPDGLSSALLLIAVYFGTEMTYYADVAGMPAFYV